MAGSGSLGGPTDWMEGGIATVLANLNNKGISPGQQIYQQGSAPLLSTAPYLAGSANNWLGQTMGSLYPQITGAPQQTQQNFQNLLGQGGFGNAMTNAGTQGLGSAGDSLLNYAANVNNNYGETLGTLKNNGNLAGQVFAGGGWTPQYQQGFDQLTQLLEQQTPGLQTSASTANNLIGNQGSNNFTSSLQNLALQEAQKGGMTPTLNMLLNPIQGIINSQGNTAQSNALGQAGQGILGSYGQTPLTQAMAQQGVNLMDQQALMNPEQASSIARNQAATQYAEQAQQMMQQALNRGGGPGATVANGMQNQTAADFADQIARGVSSAGQNALVNQEQLQLQQQGLGANLAGSSGNLQNALLGTGGNLSNASGQLANNLYLQGMGLSPTLQNSATNLLNAYGNLGSIGQQGQLGYLGAGTNLAQMLQSGQIGGLNAMTGMMGNENQYALGAGGLQNNISNNLGQLGLGSLTNAGNLYNNVFSQGLGQGQLGLGQFSGLSNALNQNYQTGTGLGSLYNNIYGNATNPLTAIMQGGLGLQNTGLQGQAGLFGGYGNALSSSGMFGSNGMGNSILGGLAGAAKGFA